MFKNPAGLQKMYKVLNFACLSNQFGFDPLVV